MMIIGFAGKKQVGKSTATRFLVERDFAPLSFASPMKSLVAILLIDCGATPQEVEFYEKNKEVAIPSLNCSMRHILQTLGTDWGRKMIHQDLWVMAAQRRLDGLLLNGGHVVIEDVRFENEANFIRCNHGLIVHIRRETGFDDKHASETGIVVQAGDAVVHNDCYMQAFLARVCKVAGL